MRQDFEKLFAHLPSPAMPDGFLEKIIRRVQNERQFLILKRKIIFFSIGLAGSTAAFPPALQILKQAFSDSAFFHFFTLLFSDFEIIVASWQSFLFSLLERLPIASLALFFSILLALLGSLKFLAKNLKIILQVKQYRATNQIYGHQ
ncbi:hypothetical protein COT68_00785 [bacterium (Candidatus Torokbacteria) CG09_land_8_20_14_0_10_42_11]|nr:MAG: hypothetical protein COT68_00785 [bacterium (Candidatus Torokbacteria) CG09_land_8_20_14_0_10_42_11]